MRSLTLRATFCVLVTLTLLLPATSHASGDPRHGEQIFNQRCTSCHDLDSVVTGPALRYAYGRRAGQGGDFVYSEALKNSGVAWSDTTLEQWLKNPEAFIPGQKMFFMVNVPQDRADIIAYLKQAAVHR